MTTFENALRAANGRPSGFDYLRIALAIVVVVVHSIDTSYGWTVTDAYWASLAAPLIRSVLPFFFALSGFLVAGSLETSKTIPGFLGLRVIRIYPALVVEVLLSALVIGPLLTTESLAAYFGSRQFQSYLLNMFGDVHFFLPGVFQHNPVPGYVNWQLWTVPYELACYLTLAGVAILARKQLRLFVLIGAITLMASGAGREIFSSGITINEVSGPLTGGNLVVCFLAGVCLYLYRHHIPLSRAAFAGALVLTGVLLWKNQLGVYFVGFPAAYCVAFVGLSNPKRLSFLKGADYSYGLFLYHFAVQQALMELMPGSRHWWLNLPLTLALTTLLAALSWHLVEKPALRLRAPLKRLEAYLLLRLAAHRRPASDAAA